MKRAYIYVRVSTEDQKGNWSVAGQEEACRLFCQRKGYEVAGVFKDEGKSAKTFDRPAWSEMQRTIRKERIDFIVVQKYDRFSRNVAEGLEMMERLESRYGLRVLSVLEDFQINPHSPVFWEFRTRALVNAEYERRTISDRTALGRLYGAKAGRWMGPAPYGYDNARDGQGKPVLIVNEAEAAIVRGIFTDYLDGLSLDAVRANATAAGFPVRHKEAAKRVLANPVYAGLIQTPDYQNERGQIIPGLHRPIVSEAAYWEAQHQLSERAGKPRHESADNLPLRGAIHCQQCARPLTGSRSRGKTGRYWWYYRCLACRGQNFRAERAEADLLAILTDLSFSEMEVEAMQIVARKRFDERLKEQRAVVAKLQREVADVTAKVEALEEKYLDGKIDDDFHRRWQDKYRREISAKQQQLDAINEDDAELLQWFCDGVPMLTGLASAWQSCPARKKAQFLRLVFGNEVEKLKSGYRTPYVHHVFAAKAKRINGLTIKENGTSSVILPESSIRSPYGVKIEPLRQVLEFLASIKAA